MRFVVWKKWYLSLGWIYHKIGGQTSRHCQTQSTHVKCSLFIVYIVIKKWRFAVTTDFDWISPTRSQNQFNIIKPITSVGTFNCLLKSYRYILITFLLIRFSEIFLWNDEELRILKANLLYWVKKIDWNIHQ